MRDTRGRYDNPAVNHLKYDHKFGTVKFAWAKMLDEPINKAEGWQDGPVYIGTTIVYFGKDIDKVEAENKFNLVKEHFTKITNLVKSYSAKTDIEIREREIVNLSNTAIKSYLETIDNQ